jgi:hypothetical protein
MNPYVSARFHPLEAGGSVCCGLMIGDCGLIGEQAMPITVHIADLPEDALSVKSPVPLITDESYYWHLYTVFERIRERMPDIVESLLSLAREARDTRTCLSFIGDRLQEPFE